MKINLQELWSPLELKIGALCGILWTLFSTAVGGVDASLTALLILTLADYLTGVYAGYKTVGLSSSKMYRGLLKKLSVIVFVMFAFLVDTAMHTDMMRQMVISGFAIVEALSILENADRMGLGFLVPSFLQARLQQIKKERGIGNESEHQEDKS